MYDLHTEPAADGGCLLDASSRIVFVLDVQRGLVTEPGGYYDEFGVHRGWYGDRAITYACDGVRQLGPTCGATGFEPVEIYVGDDLIASAIEPQILGFIDQIEASE